ncbi:hypothetical protein [uncultured Sphingomonas sp.]|uniref:hypothetical protein n=1 Tax=uncultured Sphingomonas sp. TaxID=158754 RepID=UPI0035CBDD9A
MAVDKRMERPARKRARKPAGQGVRAAGKNGPQLVKTEGSYWTEEAEALFLDQLAASCNVRTAAAAIDYTTATLYWRRRRDPAFAERWRAAMEQGYIRLESLLLEEAENALSGRMPNPDLPIPRMTVREAMDLLRMHQAAARGAGPRTPGRRAVPRPLAEVHASILAKLSAIETSRAAAAGMAGAVAAAREDAGFADAATRAEG